MRVAFRRKPKKPTAAVGWSTAHKRARELYPKGTCNRCGSSTNVDRHHKNNDWRDNRRKNLEDVCRSCHMREHRSSKPCRVPGCTRLVTEAKCNGAHGYCDMHYQRWRKWGDPLAVRVNQHTPLIRLPAGKLKPGRPRRA